MRQIKVVRERGIRKTAGRLLSLLNGGEHLMNISIEGGEERPDLVIYF